MSSIDNGIEDLRMEKSHPSNLCETTPMDLLIILARRKRLIFGFTFTASVVAVVVALVLPQYFTASALLLPPSQGSSVGAAMLGQVSSTALASLASSGLGLKSSSDMYVSLIRSRTVEDAVIQKYNLANDYHTKTLDDTRAKFERESLVAAGVKDGLIRISVEARTPARAAELANGYVEQFRKLISTLAITEAAQRRVFFEEQMTQAKDNLTKSEEQLKRTELSTGAIQLGGQTVALIQSAAALRGEIAAQEVKIQAMRSFAAEDNPELKEAQDQLSALKSQLVKLSGTGTSGDDIIMVKGQVPQASLDYARSLRDVRYYETVFELVAKQLEVARMDEARQGPLFQVVDSAIPPQKHSSPHRSIIVILSFFGSLIASMLWVLIGDRWTKARSSGNVKFQLLLSALRGR